MTASSQFFQKMGQSTWYSNCTAILCQTDSPSQRCDFATSFKTACASGIDAKQSRNTGDKKEGFVVEIGDVCDNIYLSSTVRVATEVPTDRPIEVTKTLLPTTPVPSKQITERPTSTAHRQPAKVKTEQSTDVKTNTSSPEVIATTGTPDADNVDGTTPKPTDTRPEEKSTASKGPPLPTTLSSKSNKASTSADDQPVKVSTTDGSEGKSDISGNPPTVVPTEISVSDKQSSEDEAKTATQDPDVDNVQGTTPKPTDTRTRDGPTVSDSSSNGTPLPTTLSPKSEKPSITTDDDQSVSLSTTDGSDEDKSEITESPPTVILTENWVSDEQRSASTRLSTPPMSTEVPSDESNESDVKTNASSSEVIATTGTPDGENVDGTTPKPTDTLPEDKSTASKGPPLPTTLSSKSNIPSTSADDQPVKVSTTDGSEGKSDISGSPPTVVPTENFVSDEQSSEDEATTATPDPDVDNVEGTTPKPTDTRTRDGPTVSDSSSKGPPLPTTLSPNSEKPSTSADDQPVKVSTTDGSEGKSDISGSPPTVVPTESSVSEDEAKTATQDPDVDNVQGTTPKPTDTRTRDGPTVSDSSSNGTPLPTTLSPKSEKPSITTDDDQSVSLSTTDGSDEDKSEITESPPTVILTENWVSDEQRSASTRLSTPPMSTEVPSDESNESDVKTNASSSEVIATTGTPDGDNVDGTTPKPTDTRPEDKSTASKGPPLPTTLSSKSNTLSTSADDQPVKVSTTDGSEGKSDISGSPPTVVPTENFVSDEQSSENEATTATQDPDVDNVEGTTPKPTDTRTRDGPTVSDSSSKGPPLPTTLSPKSEKPSTSADDQPVKVSTTDGSEGKSDISGSPPTVVPTESSVSEDEAKTATQDPDVDNVQGTTPKPTDTRTRDGPTVSDSSSNGTPLPTTLLPKSEKLSITTDDDQSVSLSTTDGSDEDKSEITGSPPTVVLTENWVSDEQRSASTRLSTPPMSTEVPSDESNESDVKTNASSSEVITTTGTPDGDNVDGTTPKPTDTRPEDKSTASKGPPLPTTLSSKSNKPSTSADDQPVKVSTTDGSEGKSDISGSPPTVIPTESSISEKEATTATQDPDVDNVEGTTPKPTDTRTRDGPTVSDSSSKGQPLPTTLSPKSEKPSTSADDQPVKVSTTDGSEGKSDISGSPPTVVPTESSVSEDEAKTATQDPDVDNVQGTTPKPTDTRTRDGPTVSDSSSNGTPLPTTLSPKSEKPSITTDDDQSVSLSTTDGSDEDKSEITGSPPTVILTKNWVSDEQRSASTRLSTPPMSTEVLSDESNESDVKTNASSSEVIATTGTPDGDNVDGTTPKPTDTRPEDKSTASKGPPLPTTLSSKSNTPSTSADDQPVKVSTTDGSEGKSDISGSPPTVVPTENFVSDEQSSEDEATTATPDPDVDNVEGTTPKPTDTRTRDGPTVSDSSSKGPPLPTTLSPNSEKPSTSADDQPVKVSTTDGSEGKSDISGSPPTVVPTESSVSEDEAKTATQDPDVDNVQGTTPKPTDTRTRDGPTVSDSSSNGTPLPTTLLPKSEKPSITTDDDQSVSLSTTDGSDEDKSEITGSPPTVVLTKNWVSDEQRSASTRLSTPPMSTEVPSDESNESDVKTNASSSEVITTTGTPDGDNVDGTTPKPTDTRPEDKSTASKGPSLPTTLSSKSNKPSTSADDQPVKVSTTDGSEGKSDISGSPPTVVPTESSVSEDEAKTATQDPDVDNVQGTTPKPTDTRTRDGPTVSDSSSNGTPLPTTLSPKSEKPSITTDDDQSVSLSTTDGSDEDKSEITGSPPTVILTENLVSDEQRSASTRLSTPPMSTEVPSDESNESDVKTNASSSEVIATTGTPDGDNVDGTTPKPTDTRPEDKSTASKGPPLPTTLSSKSNTPSTSADDKPVKVSTTDGSEGKSDISGSPPTVVPTENFVSDEQSSEDEATTATPDPDVDNVEGTTPKPTDTRTRDGPTVSDSSSKGPPLPTTLSPKSEKPSITTDDDQSVSLSTTDGSDEDESEITGSPPTVVPTENLVSDEQRSEDVASTRLSTPPMSTEDPSDESNEPDVETNTSSEVIATTGTPDADNVEGTTPKPTVIRSEDKSTASKGPPLPTTLSSKSNKASTSADDQPVKVSTTEGKSDISGSPPTVVPTESSVSDEQSSEDEATTATPDPDADNVEGTTSKPTDTRTRDGPTVSDSSSKGPPLQTTLSPKSEKQSITTDDDQSVSLSTTDGSDQDKSDISKGPPTVVPTESSVSGEPRSDDIPSSKFSTPPISSEDPSTGGSPDPPTTEEVSFKATSSAPLKSVQLPSPVVFPCDETSTDVITDGGNVSNQTSGENQNVKSTETATEIPTKHSDGPATKESTGGSDKVSSVTDEYDSKSNTTEDVEIGAVTGKLIDKETTEQKSKITDRSDLSRATDDSNTGSVKEGTKKSDPSSPPTIIPTVSRPITPDIGTASTKSFSPIPSTEDNRPVVASTTVYNEINSTNSSEKIGLSSRAATTLPPTPEISTTENGNVMISDTEIPTTSTAHRQPAKVSTKESVDAETTSSTIGIIVTTPSQDPDVYGTSPEPTDTQIKDKSAVSVTPTKVSGSDEQKSEDVASTRVFSSTPPTMIPSGDTRTSKNPFTNSKPNVTPTTPKKKDSSVKTDEGASSKVPVDKSSDALTTFSNGPDPTSDVTKTSDEKSNPTIIPTTEPSKDTKKCDHDEVYKMLVLDICSDIVFGDDSSWKCNKVKNLHVLFNRLNH